MALLHWVTGMTNRRWEPLTEVQNKKGDWVSIYDYPIKNGDVVNMRNSDGSITVYDCEVVECEPLDASNATTFAAKIERHEPTPLFKMMFMIEYGVSYDAYWGEIDGDD